MPAVKTRNNSNRQWDFLLLHGNQHGFLLYEPPVYSILCDHRQKAPQLFLHTFLWSTLCPLSYQSQDSATTDTYSQGEEEEDNERPPDAAIQMAANGYHRSSSKDGPNYEDMAYPSLV